MRHFQINNRKSSFGCGVGKSFKVKVNPLSPPIEETNGIAVDQFFAQSHNLVHGFVSTSPLMADNASALSHLSPVSGQSALPKDLTDKDIFNMIVSRKIQTPAELSKLLSLRPNKSNFDEPVPEPAPEPESVVRYSKVLKLNDGVAFEDPSADEYMVFSVAANCNIKDRIVNYTIFTYKITLFFEFLFLI